MIPVDQIQLNFNPQTLGLLNVILGLVMFGVALDIKLDDFRALLFSPKPILVGLIGQFILLPALTFLLIRILHPAPSIALGMILIAACPAGNLSNFLTHLANGNTALSVSISAISTAAAVLMTPLNLSLWGSLDPDTSALLREVALEPAEMFQVIFLILGLPLAAGIILSRKFPALAEKVKKPMRYFSLGVLLLFVAGTLAANFKYFIASVSAVAFIVFVLNTVALLSGYLIALLTGLPERDRRAVAIEVGIKNSGLGLILVFNFFGGLGGMAIIAAWWGLWSLISGLTLAIFWAGRPPVKTAIAKGASA